MTVLVTIDPQEFLLEANQAIASTLIHRLFYRIRRPESTKAKERESQRKLAAEFKSMLKKVLYVRSNPDLLIIKAEMWAAVRFGFDGSLERAVNDELFVKQFGRLRKSNLSNAIGPFNRALGIRSQGGRPEGGTADLGPAKPPGPRQRIDPTKWR